ncbi:MAG: hypothetical protein AAGA42_07695 [Actinomycetota bacterium]
MTAASATANFTVVPADRWIISNVPARRRPTLSERYKAWSTERREMREFRRVNPAPLTAAAQIDIVASSQHRVPFAV